MKNKEIKISIATNKGSIRQDNEDNFTINGKGRPLSRNNLNINGKIAEDELFMLGVFDGMGGEELGEIASDIGSQFCGKLMDKLINADPEDYGKLMDDYVNAANYEICTRLKNNDSKRGGTTFAITFIKDNMIYPFSLGDSRIYLFTDGELRQITEDHTLAMKKYKANIYTLEEAQKSSDSHKLTLFLGVDVDGDGLSCEKYSPFPLPAGSMMLMCSDGLYDMCDNSTITRILSEHHERPAAALVKEAIRNGGIDNITCIIADFN